MDTEERELQHLIEDKRHKEMKSAILSVAEKFKLDNVERSLLKISETQSNLLSAVKNIKLETDDKKVCDAICDMEKSIIKVLSEIRESVNKKQDFDLTVTKRNMNGLIESVTIKEK